MSFLQQGPWQIQALASSIILYFASVIIYRLLLHPLARFPGPRLAAITRYYEGYYDVVQNGQYTFRIAEMHKQYGNSPSPGIRLSDNRNASVLIRSSKARS